MERSPEKEVRFPITWDAEGYLGDIEAAAEKVVELTRQTQQMLRNSVSPCGDDEPFFAAADCRKYLQAVETEIYHMSQAVTFLASETVNTNFEERRRFNKQKHQDWNSMFKLVQQPNLLIFKSPYLRKAQRHNLDSTLPFRRLGGCVFEVNKDLFTEKQIDMYVISVYPTGIPKERVVDADNINVKAFGDTITQLLEIDDNGMDVNLLIYAQFDDELGPGSYMVIVPQAEEKMGPAKLLNTIKNSEKTYVK